MPTETKDPESAVHTVLIVDDEATCRRVFTRMLDIIGGFDVICASSAEEAQVLLREKDFGVDVCLVDLVLPEMQGEDLLGWIKAHEPRLPVVMISGSRDDDRLVRCLRNGAADFVEKPTVSEKLAQVLRHAILRQSEMNDETNGEIQIESHATDWVELAAPSEMEYLGRIQRFTEKILENRLSREVCEDLRLAFEEVGRNAIEWGNKFDRSKNFSISYCLFPDRIVFKFEDEGEGFKPTDLPNPTLDPKAHIKRRQASGKRPGGFGVYLVQKLMDEVVYSERGNVVLMAKYF